MRRSALFVAIALILVGLPAPASAEAAVQHIGYETEAEVGSVVPLTLTFDQPLEAPISVSTVEPEVVLKLAEPRSTSYTFDLPMRTGRASTGR